jgi:hypothetical protein
MNRQAHEPRPDRRKHWLELASTYQRAADQMEPPRRAEIAAAL